MISFRLEMSLHPWHNQPMATEMFEYIQTQISQAENHSEGFLTLDADRALRKLGRPVLPNPGFWLLKVVQAAVAARAPELVVNTLGSEISCSFLPQRDLSARQIARIFELSDHSHSGGWRHLQQALWALLDQKWEFECNLPEVDRCWRSSGHQLALLPGPQRAELQLTVQGVSTTELLQLLCERALLCPMPVLVNGRRLEAKTGTTSVSPIHWEALQRSDLPQLRLPSRSDCNFAGLRLPNGAKQAQALGVVSLHMESGKRGWRAVAATSFVYWILDGVWVDRQRLPFDRRSITCDVYLSAEGLTTDLDSFRLVPPEKRAERYRWCLAAAGAVIQNTRLPQELLGPSQSRPRRALYAAVTTGLVLMISVPSAGTLLATGGLLAFWFSLPSSQRLVCELQTNLEALQIQAARSGIWT